MNKITKKIEDIVNELIREESRKEALSILEKCTEEHFKDFLRYYKSNSDNVCCLVLDAAKIDLVKSGGMSQDDNDSFGKIFLDK